MPANFEIGNTGRSFLPDDPDQSIRDFEDAEFSASLDAFIDDFSLSESRQKSATAPGVQRADGNPFHLDQVIAEGGHGEVWRAVQVALDREIAVKRIRSRVYESKDVSQARTLERAFYKEALVAAQLDHPRIVPIYDMTIDEDRRPMIAMKLVEGTVWTKLLTFDRRMEPAEFIAKHVGILITVAHAVAFAHSRGILHRDLKPSQVIVGRYGEVFLMDWGLAVRFGDAPRQERHGRAAEYAESATESNSPAGTVCYMAPEQTERTGARLGPWTDIYLLAGILYYILTESRPHPQPSSADAFRHAASGVMDTPEERAPGKYIPPELSRVCMKAMSPEPGDRHGSAQEFIHDLEDYLSGASGKSESKELSRSASERIAAGELTYAEFSGLDNALSKALQLWPENEDAFRLRQKLLGDYADVALSNGDLALARVQANRMLESPGRESLLGAIADEERRIARLRTQRRVAILSAFVFVLTFGAVAYFSINLASRARVREYESKTEQTNQELKARRAEVAHADAERMANISRMISELRSGEAKLAGDLASHWLDEFPYPATFAYTPYDRDFWASREQDEILRLVQQRESYQGTRRGMKLNGIPLPDEPFELPFYAAKVLLYSAGQEGSPLPAYELFEVAHRLAPDRHEALVGMAIAAGRHGDITSATELLHRACEASLYTRGFRGDYQKLLTLQNDLNAMRWKAFALGPEDILIEARPKKPSVHRFEEVDGPWENGDKPAEWARSSAAGLGPQTDRGCRKVITFTPFGAWESTASARARFVPALAGRAEYNVYVTWAMSANAYPIQYRVKHANGESTVVVSQSGWAGLNGNANRWIPLGRYEFAPDAENCIEMIVDDGVEPVTAEWGGQAIADAVLLTPRDLPADMVGPAIPPAEAGRKVHWHHEWESASRDSCRLGKPILIFFYCPGALESHHIQTHTLIDDGILDTIAESFVPLQVHPHGNSLISWKFRGAVPGTMRVVDSGGVTFSEITMHDLISTDKFRAALARMIQ